MSVRIRLALIGLALALSAGPARAEDAGKKYALLVGVTEYDHANLATLKYTENDVEELADVLADKAAGGFHDVKVMTVTRGKKDAKLKPTHANVEKAISDLLSKVTRRDTVLIGLAGHGVTLEVKDKEEKLPAREYAYFCPTDAHFRLVSHSTGKAPRLILMSGLLKELGACGAGTKLMLVDACRNELKADSTARSFDTGELTLAKGMAAMFSCKPGEKAWETSKLGNGHGVFFHFVIEGLKGQAKNNKDEVTWSRLAEYVNEHVSEQVPKLHGKGASQTPHGAQNFFGSSPVLAKVAGKIQAGEADLLKGMDFLAGVKVEEDVAAGLKHLRAAADKKHPLALVLLGGYAHAGAFGIDKDEKEGLRLVEAGLPGLNRAVANGNATAKVMLAELLRKGLGVGKDVERAAKLVAEAADAGDLWGTYQLGVTHYLGRGVKADKVEAVKWLTKAAQKNYPDAMVALGRIREGQSDEKAKQEACEWYRKAAERGSVAGTNEYANCLLDGTGVAKDEAKGIEQLAKAADKGHARSMTQLGWRHLNKNEDAEGYKWIRRAVERGDANSMADLAYLYKTGRGVKKDDKEAFAWLTKGAAKGDAESMVGLGLCYAAGTGVEADASKAGEWYRKAADKEYVDGMFALAEWLHAREAEKDKKEAAQWYDKAAAKSHTGAMRAVGHRHLRERDAGEAATWFRKAADKGDAVAMHDLAHLYLQGGRGLDKDGKKVVEWLEKAAAKGLAAAMTSLGRSYASGIDDAVAKDEKKAVEWYRKAATAGEPHGTFDLAEALASGTGVAMDEKEALKWYAAAAEKGHAEAKEKAAALRKKLASKGK